MGWQNYQVLRKNKLLTVQANQMYKLSDTTGGASWNNHLINPSIVNIEQGFDCYGLELTTIRHDHDVYSHKIYKKYLQQSEIAYKAGIDYTQFNVPVEIFRETGVGGVSIVIELVDLPAVRVYAWYNGLLFIQNDLNGENYVRADIKYPAVDNFQSILEVGIQPLANYATTSRANITYFKRYGVRAEINGTINVLAYEIE